MAVLLTYLSTGVVAQEKPRTFGGAVLMGANFNQVHGDDLAGYHHIGLNFGARAYAFFNPKISLAFELLYSQKGSKSSISERPPTSSYYLRIDYAQIPIMINYHDKKRGILGAGLAYGRVLNKKEKVGGGTVQGDFKGPVYNQEIAWLLDGTLYVFKTLGINGRYSQSLFPFARWSSSNLPKNRVYHLNLTLRAYYEF